MNVANAVGPLAAIVHSVRRTGSFTDAISIPVWVMIIEGVIEETRVSGCSCLGNRRPTIRMVGGQSTNVEPDAAPIGRGRLSAGKVTVDCGEAGWAFP